MLTNNLFNLDIVNLMSIISDNTALILNHFSGIAVIVVPTVLMSKSDKILKALQIVASSTIATRGGVDGYDYLKHKFSGSENPLLCPHQTAITHRITINHLGVINHPQVILEVKTLLVNNEKQL